VLLVPFVGGFRPLAPDAIGLLVITYLATAVFEEGFWRGLVLGVLRPTGLWRAVLISSLLFGWGTSAIQFSAVSRQSLAHKPLARACGVSVSRRFACAPTPSGRLLRYTRYTTLFLQMGTLPISLLAAPIDTILLVYGIFLLRHGDVYGETAPAGPLASATGTDLVR